MASIEQGQRLLKSLEPPGKIINVSKAELDALLEYQREFRPLYYAGRNYVVAWMRWNREPDRYEVWLRPETYAEGMEA